MRRPLSCTAAALAVAALLAAGPPAAAADTDLARNGGFEAGLAGWSCSGGSGAVVTTPVHGGSSALKGTPAGQNNARCAQTVTVKPDSTYTLGARAQGAYGHLGAAGTGTTDVSTWTQTPGAWSWAAAPGATSYTVQQDGAPPPSVAGTSVTVTGLAASTSYTFQVGAVNAAGESPESAPVSATTSVSGTPGGPGPPDHALVGFLHTSFANGSGYVRMSDTGLLGRRQPRLRRTGFGDLGGHPLCAAVQSPE